MREISSSIKEAKDRTQEYFEQENEVLKKLENEKEKSEYLEQQVRLL